MWKALRTSALEFEMLGDKLPTRRKQCIWNLGFINLEVKNKSQNPSVEPSMNSLHERPNRVGISSYLLQFKKKIKQISAILWFLYIKL
jgi:hypothetical protein